MGGNLTLDLSGVKIDCMDDSGNTEKKSRSDITEEDAIKARKEAIRLVRIKNLVPIKKGQVLNPKGRPTWKQAEKDFYSANLSSLAVKTFERFQELMDRKSNDPKIIDLQIKVGKEVLGRKLGAIKQDVTINAEGAMVQAIDASKLSPSEQLDFIRMGQLALQARNAETIEAQESEE